MVLTQNIISRPLKITITQTAHTALKIAKNIFTSSHLEIAPHHRSEQTKPRILKRFFSAKIFLEI